MIVLVAIVLICCLAAYRLLLWIAPKPPEPQADPPPADLGIPETRTKGWWTR